jgi:hypothetical protein
MVLSTDSLYLQSQLDGGTVSKRSVGAVGKASNDGQIVTADDFYTLKRNVFDMLTLTFSVNGDKLRCEVIDLFR